MSAPIDRGLRIPEFDLADRLRKSLRTADLSVSEMAEFLGLTRETAGRYMNGGTRVPLQTVRLWAMRTGVPFEWLKDGVVPADLHGDDAEAARPARLGKKRTLDYRSPKLPPRSLRGHIGCARDTTSDTGDGTTPDNSGPNGI
jgi:transcriptional regulator with XRE-family HTH domain